ncbi:MAG: two-component regulator propeller domain-containing protein [Bacteroidales bacterium]
MNGIKPIYRNLLASLLLFVFHLASSAQQLPYNRFSAKNGLPNNQIFAIDEDEQGFLWLGTDNGLYRFDGTNFDAVKKPSFVQRGRIAAIASRHDSLFVTSHQGITIMSKGKTEDLAFLKHFFDHSIDASKITNLVVHENRNDSLLVRIHSSDKSMEKITYLAKNKLIYPCSKTILRIPDDYKRVFLPEHHDFLLNRISELPKNQVNVEFMDSQGGIWIGTEQGLYQVPSLAFEYFS